MPGNADYNVAVLVTLRNRISQGLRLIARDFAGAQRGVTALQRSLNDLQTRHALYDHRVRTTEATERQRTSELQSRLAASAQLAASEHAIEQSRIEAIKVEAAERARMGRVQAEQLRGLQKRVAMQKVAARESADAQSIRLAEQRLSSTEQMRQIRMSELQGQINRRNAIAQLRSTEAQNALLRQQERIQARNAELSAARRARGVRGLISIGGAALIGAAGAIEAAKVALPISMMLQQIRIGANLTATQAAGLPQLAMGLSTQSTQFTYKQVLNTFRRLMPRYGYAQMTAAAPQMFALAGLEREMGLGTSLSRMSAGIMQALTTLHANTQAQQNAALEAMTAMLFRFGASPETFAQTLRTIGVSTTRLPFSQRLQASVLTQAMMSLGGSQVGLTAAGIANIFKTLLIPRIGSQIALAQLLNPRHLQLTGLHAVRNAMGLIANAPRGFTLPERIMMGPELPQFLAMQNLLSGQSGARIRAALSAQMDPQKLLAKSLNTAAPAMRNLATSLENFVAIIGKSILGGHFPTSVNKLASGYEANAKYYEQHGFWRWFFRELNPFQHPIEYTPHTQHVTVHVHAAADAEGTAKAVVRHIKQSAMSNTKARGPIASPHVYSGSHP